MFKPQTRLSEIMQSVARQRSGLIFLSCLVNLLLLVTAIYMLQIYDRVLSSGSYATLGWLTVIALVAIAAYGVLEQSRRLILSRTAAFIEKELNAPVLEQTMQQSLDGERPETGVRDVSDLRNFYQSDAALAFLDAPWSLVFIAFVWLLHPVLGLIATLGAAVLLGATVLNDFLTRQRQREAAGAVRAANEAAIRFVDAGETISPLGMAPAIFSRWRHQQDAAHSEQQELGEKTTTILSFTRSLRQALQISVLGLGAYLALGGQITPGAMIAASIITARALAPIDRLTAAWHRFVASRAAKKRLTKLFDVAAKAPERIDLPRPAGRVSVENVSYLLNGAGIPLLQGVTFDIDEPGTCCAVIGRSGIGKSTLCRMLVGLWKPTVGHVRLDGADVFKWDPAKLGQHIGYLPQVVELFPGTIAQNIARFRDVDSGEVIAAARMAGVHDMVLSLPEGYETEIGPARSGLSLGQRQRIGLARAVFGRPSFVVLDEPNSNLDRAGDAALLETLNTLKGLGTTTVIVSHRPEVLKAADRILVLKDGTLSELSTHEEVLTPTQTFASRRPHFSAADAASKPAPVPKTAGPGAQALVRPRQKIVIAPNGT